ncbi:recombinase family protein, partial [Pseudoxanthomonas mexicana]
MGGASAPSHRRHRTAARREQRRSPRRRGRLVKVGYARVSTNEQDAQTQRDFLLAAGVDEDRIYSDVGFTGKNAQREGLRQA